MTVYVILITEFEDDCEFTIVYKVCNSKELAESIIRHGETRYPNAMFEYVEETLITN
jgi:hypothetical protein